MDWNAIDWAVLERLRAHFLDREAGSGPYWQNSRDLEMYDFTFGRRIAWKWAAVLERLFRHRWHPPASRLIDWGCGSGIAARSMLAYAPRGTFDDVNLWDHSPSATSFAASRIAKRFPKVNVRVAEPSAPAAQGDAFVLVISHVINELDDDARANLLGLARQAAAVIWIEPGTPEDSRALIAVREVLRADFQCLAPCLHNEICGLLSPKNERHWCHHFAPPPTEAFTSPGWARFNRMLGIDPRSVPYSYLVLDRQSPPKVRDENRIIGTPRESAGLMRILRCRVDGVTEVELQKRDDPALWKTLHKERHDGTFTWWEKDGRIQPSTS